MTYSIKLETFITATPYRATIIDENNKEHVAVEAIDPYTALRLVADIISDRELKTMQVIYPDWTPRKNCAYSGSKFSDPK